MSRGLTRNAGKSSRLGELVRPAEVRRRFLRACWRELCVVWPILSGLTGLQLVLGLVIGYLENWAVSEAVYFSFVTGLTIGYGDFAPKRLAARILAITIGFIGILVTGLIAAIGVRALQVAMEGREGDSSSQSPSITD